MSSRQFGALAALAVAWGASFLFIKVIIDAGGAPVGVSFGRSALGALVLAPAAWRMRSQFPHTPAAWLTLVILGFFNFALPWTLFAVAAQHAPSSVSAIVNSSSPLWAAIFATILVKADRLNRVRIAGLLCGFLGVVLLMGQDLLRSGGSASAFAVVLMLAATLCYGFCAVAIRRWMHEVPAIPLAFGQLAIAACFLLPVAAVSGLPTPSLGANAILSLLALGLLNSGIGVMCMMWLIHEVGPVRAIVVTYLIPPIGVFLGWLVLGETIGWSLVLGLAFVIAGVALVQQISPRAVIRRLTFRLASNSAEAAAPD